MQKGFQKKLINFWRWWWITIGCLKHTTPLKRKSTDSVILVTRNYHNKPWSYSLKGGMWGLGVIGSQGFCCHLSFIQLLEALFIWWQKQWFQTLLPILGHERYWMTFDEAVLHWFFFFQLCVTDLFIDPLLICSLIRDHFTRTTCSAGSSVWNSDANGHHWCPC